MFSEGWDPAQLQRRLRNTKILHKGKLWNFQGADTVKSKILLFLDNEKFPLEEVDLRTPRFGFTNVSSVGKELLFAAFVTRIPVRNDWRQGITEKQLRVTNNVASRDLFVGENKRNLEKSLSGVFPSVSEALIYLEEEHESVALSRSVALRDDKKILFQANPEPVGWFNNNKIYLNQNCKFLKQNIQKETRIATE